MNSEWVKAMKTYEQLLSKYLVFGIFLALFLSTMCSSSNEILNNNPEDDIPTLQLPVEGTWKVLDSPGHDRFEFDLVAVDPQTGRSLKKSRLDHLFGNIEANETYSWEEPVYAPANGVVVRSNHDSPDRLTLSLARDVWNMVLSTPEFNPNDISPFAGNYVIIRAQDVYIFLAHFKQNSLIVKEGDSVNKGEIIARVGNSGLSMQPHLHIQLMDQIEDFESAKAPAFLINSFEYQTDNRWKSVSNHILQKSQIIRNY